MRPAVVVFLVGLFSAGNGFCLWPFSSSVPKIVKDSAFEKETSYAVGKFGNLEKMPCGSGGVIPDYKKRFGSLECYRARLMRLGGFQEVDIMTHKDKVVYIVSSLTDSSAGLGSLPKVSEYLDAGDPAPKYIALKQNQQYVGLNIYHGSWLWDGKVAKISAVCPKSKVGNKLVQVNFRDCHVMETALYYMDESKVHDGFKKNDHKF